MNYKEKLEEYLNIVIKEGASDLHLSSGRKPAIRVSGSLLYLERENKLTNDDTINITKVLIGETKLEKFLKEKEIDFSYSLGDKARFRSNCYFQQESVAIAMRLVPKRIKTLKELNLPNVLERFARKEQGFFLVVGPVGHGKTTTLAAIIDLINSERADHIITIEDPVEFIFEKKKSIIDQREIKVDTKDFKTAIRSMFRQDVDVVMIGEMRGAETMSTAVTAAETGHLVLSTLHTNNASQTINRIIDSFSSDGQAQIRTQLAGSLTGIFSQRLIPRISGGLIPAYELLINNNAVANLIREGRVYEIDTVIETGMEFGMINMNRSLAELVKKGEITLENAKKYATNLNMLERFI